MHALFTQQHFADRQLARQEPMYICFLDLRAAYDRVSRIFCGGCFRGWVLAARC